jgi:hypothetical protein
MQSSKDLKRFHNVKSMLSAKKHSMPKLQSSSNYLDMYLLEKEKERILQEIERVGKRQDQIKYRLGEIDKELAKNSELSKNSKEKVSVKKAKKTVHTEKEGQKKEWKTMDLNY